MAKFHFRDLAVWQKGIDLVEEIYLLTAQFPEQERYGLTVQLRRAAVSIPSNIAEGRARHTSKDFLRFLSMAQGSLAELITQTEIAHRLKYVDNAKRTAITDHLEELSRMIRGLQKSIRVRAEQQ